MLIMIKKVFLSYNSLEKKVKSSWTLKLDLS